MFKSDFLYFFLYFFLFKKKVEMSSFTLPNESNIPLWQSKESRDSELVFMINDELIKIPWPKSFLHPYVPTDYSKLEAHILKDYLIYRNITPCKTKAGRVQALENWDRMICNQTKFLSKD